MTTIAVDNSILRSVATCTTKTALEMVLGFQAAKEVGPLKAGKAVHESLAAWFLSDFDTNQAMQVLAKEYQAWAGEHIPKGDRLGWENVSAIMRTWYKMNAGRLAYRLKDVEHGFRFPLTDGIDFVGLLDGFGVGDSGHLRVIEHKTTGSLTSWWKAKWRVDSQISGYLWGASEYLGKPIVGAYINAIELKKLPSDPSKKCKDHGTVYAECGPIKHAKGELIPVQRTEAQITTWKVNAIRLAKRYEKLIKKIRMALGVGVNEGEQAEWADVRAVVQELPQEGTFTASCQFCQFDEFCETGRRAKGLLAFKPWDPAAHAKLKSIT